MRASRGGPLNQRFELRTLERTVPAPHALGQEPMPRGQRTRPRHCPAACRRQDRPIFPTHHTVTRVEGNSDTRKPASQPWTAPRYLASGRPRRTKPRLHSRCCGRAVLRRSLDRFNTLRGSAHVGGLATQQGTRDVMHRDRRVIPGVLPPAVGVVDRLDGHRRSICQQRQLVDVHNGGHHCQSAGADTGI